MDELTCEGCFFSWWDAYDWRTLYDDESSSGRCDEYITED